MFPFLCLLQWIRCSVSILKILTISSLIRTQNSEMYLFEPLDYRNSTKRKSNIYNVQIGVWETPIKTKRNVASTDATQWYCSAHFTFQNLIKIRLYCKISGFIYKLLISTLLHECPLCRKNSNVVSFKIKFSIIFRNREIKENMF